MSLTSWSSARVTEVNLAEYSSCCKHREILVDETASLNALSWKYVDDTAVSGIIPKGLSSSAQEYVDSVVDWTVDNRFQLNIDKRKEIRIS